MMEATTATTYYELWRKIKNVNIFKTVAIFFRVAPPQKVVLLFITFSKLTVRRL